MQRDQQPATASDRAHTHDLREGRMRPYRIAVEQTILDDLEIRLDRARWTDVSTHDGWKHGTSPAFLRELVGYWRSGYDWRRQEARLNTLPQFLAGVDGEDLHFVHVRGRRSAATPVLLLHGWPDSFYRFHRVIPELADPADHVDVPVAMALFPADIGGVPPRSFAERTLNVQRWTELPRGGHFAALEEPELYARDVVEFLRSLPSDRAASS